MRSHITSLAFSAILFSLLLTPAALAIPVTFEVNWQASQASDVRSSDVPAHAHPEQARIELQPAGGGGDGKSTPLSPHTLDVAIPGKITLDLPVDSLWRVDPQATGAWAPSQVIAVTTERDEHSIRLIPTSVVTGKVQVAGSATAAPAIDELSVRLTSTPDHSLDIAAATLACPITTDGDWRCELPIGRYDLRLGARGHAPVYLWGQDIQLGATQDLGDVTLLAGASLSGSVVLEPQLDSRPAITVELQPATARLPTDATNTARSSQLHRLAAVDEQGHFQFTELPSGEFFVVARGQGYSTTTAGPFTVFAPNESVVEAAISLRPPTRLELAVQPPTAPSGEPWRLHLRPVPVPGRDLGRVHTARAALDGNAVFDDLPHGDYFVTVMSAHTQWITETVEARAGAAVHEIEVPLVTVVGKLDRGDLEFDRSDAEPGATGMTLWFVEQGTRKRSRFHLDGDEFTGYLPYEGAWQALLYDAAKRERHILDTVEVEVSAASGVARVDLVVPDGEIAGQVVDLQGEPVAGIEVQLAPWEERREASTAVSDEDGRFNFDLLHPGSYRAAITDDRYALVSQRVDLQADLDPAAVVLRLEEERVMTFRVSAEGFPLPGARVTLVPQQAARPSTLRRVAQGMTGVEGWVELGISQDVSQLTAIVLAPGFAARFLNLELPTNIQSGGPRDATPEPVDIALQRQGGTLTLTWTPDSTPRPGVMPTTPTLIYDDTVIGLPLLLSWARERGSWDPDAGTLSLPMLEPGQYTACAPRSGRDNATSQSNPDCHSGFLTPSGQLHLQLGG